MVQILKDLTSNKEKKMNKWRTFFPVFIILGLTAFGLVYFQRTNAHANTLQPDSPENQEIISTLENGYAAIAYAAETNDVTQLPNFFIDNPAYQPAENVKKNIEQVFGPDIARKAGYLTAIQAKYIARGNAEKKMAEAMKKAHDENRELTKEEFQQVVKESNGVIPPTGQYHSKTGKNELTVDKISVFGETASIFYDDGAAYQKATLVRINNQWFIANIEAQQIHF